MTEVTENAKSYMHFHDMVEYRVVTSTHNYLTRGEFTDSVVDVVVPGTAQALQINLFIYCQDGQYILLVPVMCRGSTMDVYLKYNCAGGTYHGSDHYTPLVHKQGTFRQGTPKILLTSVLTPAAVCSNILSSNNWDTSRQTQPLTSSQFVSSSGGVANIASISTFQSGNKTSVEPSLSSSANHGGGLYNLPCTIPTGAQSFAKKTFTNASS